MKLLNKTLEQIMPANLERMKKKEKELNALLKTPGGLGKLEELAIQMEGIRENYVPSGKVIVVMAADNGVESEGVSKSRKVITQYVVEAMVNGKASVNALGSTYGADIKVIDLGIDERTDERKEINLSGVIGRKLMKYGTDNITEGAAMDYETAVKAIEIGIETVDQLVLQGYNLFATGEMGIGNTTTSSALLKAYTDLPLKDIVGYGSGIDEECLIHKIEVIRRALEVNGISKNEKQEDTVRLLSKVGGLDIAGMTGIFLGCGKNRVPVVIDGFISAVAALTAYRMNRNVKDYMIASHMSEEPGMKYIMSEMGLIPSLFMNMKLGEGSGAVMMFPVIEGACSITGTVRKYPELE